jgi:pimeloyl-ACP methyl ester carboxylesterase
MSSPTQGPASQLHRGRFTAGPLATYYDQIPPAAPTRHPTLLLIHGGAHTGSCWLTTADGRPGWASRLAARGYPTLVPDWPGHGRSGAIDPDKITGELLCQGLAGLIDSVVGPVVLLTHSMGGALGWRLAELRAGRVAGIVALAPAPPGNIQPLGEIERETDTELWIRTATRTSRIRRSGFSGHDPDFVTSKLVGDSRLFPRAALPAYSRMLTTTAARLLFERQNTRGAQLRVADPGCFAGKKILIVTGSEDLDHPREIDEPIAAWLRGHGARAEFVWLADHGLPGHGHMLMMEENSDAIADLVLDWLDHGFGAG